MYLTDAIGMAEFAFLAAVVTAAFAVRGATGLGSAAIAVPLAALAVPVQLVIPVVAGLQLVSTAEFSLRNWRNVCWTEMLRIAPGMVLGVLVGLYLFCRLDTQLIAKGLGMFVAAYAIYAVVTADRTDDTPARLPWLVAMSLNAGGAFLGALFGGASSPFYAIYLRALHLSRDAFRATMTMVILAQMVLRIGGYAGMGLFDAATLLASVAVLPFTLLGARLGDVVADRVAPRTFNWLVGVALLISGTALALK